MFVIIYCYAAECKIIYLTSWMFKIIKVNIMQFIFLNKLSSSKLIILFLFSFLRDPNVSKTLDSFNASVDWLVKTKHSDQDIDEAKLGVFSEVKNFCLIFLHAKS